jgi:hypothetical protein
MIRDGAGNREASWDEALSFVAAKFKPAYERGKAGALLSSLCTDEELSLFSGSSGVAQDGESGYLRRRRGPWVHQGA